MGEPVGEPVLARLKTLRARAPKDAEYLICDSKTRIEILDSNWVGHMMDMTNREIRILGLRFAIVDTADRVLEIR